MICPGIIFNIDYFDHFSIAFLSVSYSINIIFSKINQLYYRTSSAVLSEVKSVKLHLELTEQLNLKLYDAPYLNFRFCCLNYILGFVLNRPVFSENNFAKYKEMNSPLFDTTLGFDAVTVHKSNFNITIHSQPKWWNLWRWWEKYFRKYLIYGAVSVPGVSHIISNSLKVRKFYYIA